MKIKAIAPWLGAKRNIAKWIIAELGEHKAYWEPFCGSLAVLLEKPQCTMETANDLNGDLINLARCLADSGESMRLYCVLQKVLIHEQLFKEYADSWRARGRTHAGDAIDVKRAVEFMICSWMGRNGVAGTQSHNQGFCARYTKNGGHAAKRWISAVESIPDWHDRLRNVTILNRDAFDLLLRIEDATGVVIYCDPPYIKKGAKYVHDFDGEFYNLFADGTVRPVGHCFECDSGEFPRRISAHEYLARLLSRFEKTRVVVSYYDHPELDRLYPGWAKVSREVTKAMVNQGMRDRKGSTKATEVLLINGPSFSQPAEGRLL